MNGIARVLLPHCSAYMRLPARCMSKVIPVGSGKYANDQMEYLKSVTENKTNDWTNIKTNMLKIHGSVTLKNVDGIMLKFLVKNNKIDAALSFADHLRSSDNELNLGSINGLLTLYYDFAKTGNKLSDKEKEFILQTYRSLYDKYKVLDSTTCERLLHALCIIDEWKKALKVLDDIYQSCIPTHSAYSTLIAMFFRLNKKSDAMKLIEKSVSDRRPLQDVAYEQWIKYILRKYKEKKTIVKYLEQILLHISMNVASIPAAVAEKISETYSSLGWNVQYTSIRKQDGLCYTCKEKLDCLKLSDEEFDLVQKNVKDKLIVGSDLFLKTSPNELTRFLQFVEKTSPYDIVLDALNISFAVGNPNPNERIKFLTSVVEHFNGKNKRIMLLGRKHMLKWPNMGYILKMTSSFFTDNLSQDDPYFITAAILSGSHTDIVSKDLLRGHRFQMQDEQLRFLFQRWQWQHQWMVFLNKRGQPLIQPPLSVTPCAQKKDSGWHIPYEKDDVTVLGRVRDGTPDWSSWLCLRPSLVR